MLPRKGWRLDLSFRTTDDTLLMNGSEQVTRVVRPKVDFEHGLVRPGFHQDLGGRTRFLQIDAAYGLNARTTVLTSAPILSERAYDIGHPPVLTERYETWGLGDTLVAVRRELVAKPERSLVGTLGVELPTGRYRLASAAALFDVGVLDPMLQPGSGSFDLVASLQGSLRLSRGGLDLTAGATYQANTTNDLAYRYGDDAIASLGPGAPRRRTPSGVPATQGGPPGPQRVPGPAGGLHRRDDRLRGPRPLHEPPQSPLALRISPRAGLPLRER